MFENMEGKEEREREEKYKKAQFEKNKEKFKNEEENQFDFVCHLTHILCPIISLK